MKQLHRQCAPLAAADRKRTRAGWAPFVVGFWLALAALAPLQETFSAEAETPAPAAVLPPRPAGEANAAAGKQVLLQFKIYRVLGDISGDTSLTDNIWEKIDEASIKTQKKPFTFFTLANLTIGKALNKVKFVADEKSWTWDGKDSLPSGKNGPVEMLSTPKVMVLPGQAFQVWIGAQAPVQYFEPRPDGRFELKTLTEPTGLGTSATVELAETGRVILRDFTIQVRTVEERKKLEGVSLDVGWPVINTRESKTSLAVQPGRDYGAMVRIESYGMMILRIRVEVTGAG